MNKEIEESEKISENLEKKVDDILEMIKKEEIESEIEFLNSVNILDQNLINFVKASKEEVFKEVWKRIKNDMELQATYKKFNENLKSNVYPNILKDLNEEKKGVLQRIFNGQFKKVSEIEDLYMVTLRKLIILHFQTTFKLTESNISDLIFYFISRKRKFKKQLITFKIFFQVKTLIDNQKPLVIFQDNQKKIYKLTQKCFILSNHDLFTFKPSSKDILIHQLIEHNISKNTTTFQYLDKLNNIDNIEEILNKKFNKLSLLLIEDKEYILLTQIFHSYVNLLFTSNLDESYKFSSFLREMLMNFLDYIQPFVNINLKINIDLVSSFNLIEKYLYDKINSKKEKDIIKEGEIHIFHSILNYQNLKNLFVDNENLLAKRFNETTLKVENSNEEYIKNVYMENKSPTEIYINLEGFKIIPYWGNTNSPHIIIFISGFTSKNDDEEINWERIVKYEEFRHYDKYFVKWDSKEPKENLSINNVIKYFYSALTFKSNNLFREAQKSAKIHGILLAYTIASKKYFQNKTITLVGFSLGCHVIKHCIKEIYLIDRFHTAKTEGIVQNLIFLAGATTFKNQSRWGDILQTVPGKIINVISTKDYILKYLFMNFGLKHLDCILKKNNQVAIGIKDIVIEVGMKDDKKKNLFANYDLSGDNIGHKKYSSLLDTIFRIANFK